MPHKWMEERSTHYSSPIKTNNKFSIICSQKHLEDFITSFCYKFCLIILTNIGKCTKNIRLLCLMRNWCATI